MNKKLNTFLLILLAAVFIISLWQFARMFLEYREIDNIYNEAAQSFISEQPAATAGPISDDPLAAADEAAAEAENDSEGSGGGRVIRSVDDVVVDFAALKAVNSEIIGWLIIENTVISYPLLKAEDNDKYLHTTYNGQSSKAGAIFMDAWSKSDFSSANTVIYGHNMRNRSMFGGLRNFNSQSYFEGHRYFYILTETGRLKYAIFAAYTADIDSISYQRKFATEEDFTEFLLTASERTQISSGVTVSAEDKVVTLSTCTPNSNKAKRFVVQGKLIEDTRI